MPILTAENHFRKGLVALVEGRPNEAAAQFHLAMKIEMERGVGRPQMRYLSYYGAALAEWKGATADAIQACETAARRDFFNPDLQLNLARVYRRAGKRTRALATIERGLQLAPRHRALRDELSNLDRRRRPPLPWLSRSHPANRMLGRARASLANWSFRTLLPGRTVTPS